MRRFLCLLSTVLCLLALPALAQQDFKWSWEGKTNTPPSTSDLRPSTSSPDFRWSWEKNEPGAGVRPPPVSAQPRPGATPAAPGGVPASAYNELLTDNLALRKKVDEAELARQGAERETAKLKRDMADLETRMAEMVTRIKTLQQQSGPPSGDLDRVMQLEAELAAATQAQANLQAQVKELRQRVVEAAADGARAAADQAPGMAPGADLLRDLERENRVLKNKLVDVETARQGLQREQERQEAETADMKRQRDRMASQLAQARAETRRYQRAAKTLQKEIPRLKQELAEQDRTGPRTRLDPSRKLTATSKEQRDMHYNMGVLLQQEGRFKEAEKEYLRAMRIDPSDGEVHYNLGVLYDDNLDNDSRAAVHYRVYLRLKPSAEDTAQVREWLAAIEGE